MAIFKNYYLILGVEVFAKDKTIKAAYRRLARRYHPDLNAGNRHLGEKFKEINEAYATLSNPQKRTRYDQSLQLYLQAKRPSGQAAPAQPSATRATPKGPQVEQSPSPRASSTQGPAAHTPISDLFDSFLKGFSFSAQSPAAKAPAKVFQKKPAPKVAPGDIPTVPERGEDIEVETLLDGGEVRQGFVKTVLVEHHELCRKCAGTGRLNGLTCPDCQGRQSLAQQRKIDVRIPPGVKSGSKVRVAGEGGRGKAGGPPGDLFLKILLRPDASTPGNPAAHAAAPKIPIGCVADGSNLCTERTISVPQAVMGTEITLNTLSGSVTMSIPPGTQSGKVFRLRGQGLPNATGPGGDYLVMVTVRIPQTLGARERELYQQLLALEKP